MARLALTIFAAALTSACGTGIQITKVDDTPTSKEGAPWNLPMTRYSITIARQLTKCGAAIDGQVETLVSAGIAVDPDQRYLLASNGWFATSSIHSQLATSGISTSLNASSEDQTGAVISNVIGTAAQVAIGAAAFAPSFAAAEKCKPQIKTAVDKLFPARGDSLEKIVKKATQELAKATANVALLTTQVGYDKTLKPKLMAELKQQKDAKDVLDIAQANLDVALKLTTHTQVVTWPLNGRENRRDTPFEIDDSVLAKWLVDPSAYPTARLQFAVYAALLRFDGGKKAWVAPLTDPPQPDLKVGVPVRFAGPARLLVCAKSQCVATMGETALPGPDVFMADGTALQFGTMYVVPAAGGHFKSESAAITLDASGAPTSIQIDEKVAAAAAATAAAKDAATQIAALPASLAAVKLATKAETDQLNAEAALASTRATAGLTPQTAQVKAQTDLINAQSALDQANANIGTKNETAGVEAQTALLEAQAALETARENAGIAPEKSALAAQASLINAQVARLNAAAARAKAQAEMPDTP